MNKPDELANLSDAMKDMIDALKLGGSLTETKQKLDQAFNAFFGLEARADDKRS